MKIRGFERVYNAPASVQLPKRGTKASAGYDFFVTEEINFAPGATIKVKTGIKAYMNEDEVLYVYVRSSSGIKGIILLNTVGIIDSDYYGNSKNDGEIICFLKNNSDQEIKFEPGDRIVQGVFQKYLIVDEEEIIKNERSGGFGHTNT